MENNITKEDVLFENNFHERLQFAVEVDGKEYRGHYRNGEIDWLNPHPKNTLDDAQLEDVESNVHDHMQNYDS